MKAFKVRIAGILCEVQPDEGGLGFVDVHIAEGQKLLPEWIVRGALDLSAAKVIAHRVLKERLAGRIIIHDVEGRIFSMRIPPTEADGCPPF